MTATYTGHLKRGDTEGTITGEIRDSWGWVITLTGARNAGGGYTLTGILGEPPLSLHIGAIDDKKGETSDAS